ncbi:MAG: glycosyltransferase family 4 protein [Patescibacteria group bacterium]
MKIAEVTSTFPPYQGGMGNVAYYNAWALATLGHEVTVFTPRYRYFAKYMDEYPFTVKRIYPWFRYGNSGVLPQLLWQIKNFDVIHLHYPFFGGAEIIYFLEQIKDLKLVITYHMDVVGSGLLSKVFKWHTNFIMPKILDQADKIIVTSWDYAKNSTLAERLAAEPEKFAEIPCGVNHLLFKPRYRDKELMTKYDLYNKQIVLFVGALDRPHYFKGVNILIQAISHLNDNDNFRVLIAGGGELLASYQSLVDTLGLGKKIIFLGRVEENILPKLYSLADIFVLPSIDKSEAFGIVALEAMSSGVPVIASDLAGVRSVVKKKETGLLVKPGSVQNLADMLDYLLKNPRIARAYGQAGRQRVLESYTWEHIGRQLDDLITNL